MAFRSLGSVPNTVNGLWQAGVVSQIDDGMRSLTGEWWFEKKTEWAAENAKKAMQKVA
jgi:hypothetical protein